MLIYRPSSMMAPLFSAERAEAAALRHWGAHDARRLALAVTWGRYGEADAEAELATTLAWHAQQARIMSISCRKLAASMLVEQLEAIEARHNTVLSSMITAANRYLLDDPKDVRRAAHAAADIARAEVVPPELIVPAFRIAQWRARSRA